METKGIWSRQTNNCSSHLGVGLLGLCCYFPYYKIFSTCTFSSVSISINHRFACIWFSSSWSSIHLSMYHPLSCCCCLPPNSLLHWGGKRVVMRAVPACGHFSSSCVFSLSLLVLALLPTISYYSPLLPCMHDPFFSSSSHLFECAFSKLSPFLFPSHSVPHCCCVILLLIPLLQLIHSPPFLVWSFPSCIYSPRTSIVRGDLIHYQFFSIKTSPFNSYESLINTLKTSKAFTIFFLVLYRTNSYSYSKISVHLIRSYLRNNSQTPTLKLF